MQNLNIKIDRSWLPSQERPLLITGPCSAESESQVLKIAEELQGSCDIFRAGIWKPRTRPNSFEGIGYPGLKWLAKVKKEFGYKVATEVASKEHVEAAFEHGIDVLWLGARTTVNPFLVQEIADALKSRPETIVLVKNPVSPDLNLWVGAIERLYFAGIKKLGAIHRGFKTYEAGKFRNPPNWSIPIELKCLLPDLPLVCDPSHITGDHSLVEEVCRRAIMLRMDGLMIETHYDPANALSDKEQQITPAQLKKIINQLDFRVDHPLDSDSKTHLEVLRGKIDVLDKEIVQLIAERMKLVKDIKKLKDEADLPVLQPARWQEMMEQRVLWAEKSDLSSEFILEIFSAIHNESVKKQIF